METLKKIYRIGHGPSSSHTMGPHRAAEQFEQRTHKRLIDIHNPSPKIVEAMQKMDLPAGVYVDVKMQ